MECPISPLGDRIVILPNDEGEQMYGNIVVPDMGKGQTVLVPKFGAQTMTVENETYIMASENDVLGTLNIKENDNE